jgi:hypothetical protein
MMYMLPILVRTTAYKSLLAMEISLASGELRVLVMDNLPGLLAER